MSTPNPHPLLASSPDTFYRVLKRYGFDKKNLPKLIGIGAAVVARQPVSLYTKLRYGKEIANQEIQQDPLFVVGHWRSGTTHLQNLLSKDPQFANVTLAHAALPHEAPLLTGKRKEWIARSLPTSRLMDNLPVGIDVPWEEELGMAACSLFSYYHISSFGQKMNQVFEDTVLLEDASEKDKANWWKAYSHFLRMVQRTQPNQRLLLKNPANTARIRLLLNNFPRARFLHIHRNPYDVFSSTVHLHEKAQEAWGLQETTRDLIVDHVLNSYPLLMRSWCEQKNEIPAGQLAELRFEDLIIDPIATLQQAYSKLELDGFDDARPNMEAYLSEHRNYQKNKFRLSEVEKERIATEWEPWFKALGYDT